jgi:hypothetical protein
VRFPTYSEAVATLALFVALGGTSYAVTSLPADSVGTSQLKPASVTAGKLHSHSVGAAAVALDSLTGKQIDESSLGEVPKAKNATSADSANSAKTAISAQSATTAKTADSATTAGTATTAVTAATATNATLLGGAPPASYHVGCPSGMHQTKDLCFELGLRADATFSTALVTCGAAGLRVPSMAEAEEAFNDLGAPQETEWTDTFFVDGGTFQGVDIGEDSNRGLQFGSVRSRSRGYCAATTGCC